MKLIYLIVMLAIAAPALADESAKGSREYATEGDVYVIVQRLQARIEQLEARDAPAAAAYTQADARKDRARAKRAESNRLIMACGGRGVDWVSRSCDD